MIFLWYARIPNEWLTSLIKDNPARQAAMLARDTRAHDTTAWQTPRSVLILIREDNEMTIHLSKDEERFVHDAVRAGLYASEAAVVSDALNRLRQTMPKPAGSAAKKAKSDRTTPKKKLTRAEFDQHLIAIGLISQLPDTDADYDDPDDEPVPIRGEPLSETVIRERR